MSETTPVQTEPQSTQTPGIAALDERAYHELVQQLKEDAVPEKTETPKEEPKAEAPKAEEPQEEQAQAAPEETPAEEAKPEEAQPDKPELDEVDEVGRLPERVRVGTWNEVERKALQIRARNPDLTLEQALDMVKKGNSEEAAVSPDTLLDQIEKATQAKAQALKALEFDKVAESELQIIKLQRDMRQAEARARELEVREQEARQTASEEAKSRSVKYYPDAAKADSPLVRKMNEIYEDLRATDNPLVRDPQMPWKLTQMAANELGIAPRVNGAVKAKPVAPVQAPSSSVARPKNTPIASGNARTTPQPQPTAAELAAKIEDLDQLMALASKL